MDIDKLFADVKPVYFFPELLHYLRNDLLPGLSELKAEVDESFNSPSFYSYLSCRLENFHDDLMNALAGVQSGNTKLK